jgi:hypothetical protein
MQVRITSTITLVGQGGEVARFIRRIKQKIADARAVGADAVNDSN